MSSAGDRLKKTLGSRKLKQYLEKNYQSAEELLSAASNLADQGVTSGVSGGRFRVSTKNVKKDLQDANTAYQTAFDSATDALEASFKRETRYILQELRALEENAGTTEIESKRNAVRLASVASSFSMLYRDTTTAYTNLNSSLNEAAAKSFRFAQIKEQQGRGKVANNLQELKRLQQMVKDLDKYGEFEALFSEYEDYRQTYLTKKAESLDGRAAPAPDSNRKALDDLMGAYAAIALSFTHLAKLVNLFKSIPTARAANQVSMMLIRMEELYDELKQIVPKTIENSLTAVPYAAPAGDDVAHKAVLEGVKATTNSLPPANMTPEGAEKLFGDLAAEIEKALTATEKANYAPAKGKLAKVTAFIMSAFSRFSP